MYNGVKKILEALIPGQDWGDEAVKRTPERFARMIEELTTPEDFDFTTFPNTMKGSEMVVVGPIPFVSLCSHHIVPFVGEAWIAYIPDELVAGLSKLPRAVKWWSRGLWTQEELTDRIASYLDDELDPTGVAIMMRAEHMCMTIRGVQSPGTRTQTTSLRGAFLDPPTGRDPKGEFLDAIKR